MTAGPIVPTGSPVLPELSMPAVPASAPVQPQAVTSAAAQSAASPASPFAAALPGATEGNKPAQKPAPLAPQAQAALSAGMLTFLRLRIEYDQGAGDFVYYGVDPQTGKVVNQYPTPEELARATYWRKVSGLVVDENS